MKDLKRLLVYGGSAAVIIFFLSYLATSGKVSGNVMVAIAVLLVVILPVVLMIWVGRRERLRHPGDGA